MKVTLTWITPDAEAQIVRMARVSNPAAAKQGHNPSRLISYLISHRHWSPFEMASACFEIETTRDIGRQVLRHRSFSFQEFSQRYADIGTIPAAAGREARLQDHKNRQSSLELANDEDDKALAEWWADAQTVVWNKTTEIYEKALAYGIAKEVARAVMPEGMSPTRFYMAGTIRSWFHYISVRATPDTQKEHRQLAYAINDILAGQLPAIFSARETTQ